jgi:TonB-dependent starch-binding outer membrane protein SusC
LLINVGEMRNRGIEIDLNFDVIKTKDMRWSIGGNYAYNDNKILSLGSVNEFEQGTSIIRVGLPLGSHFVVGWNGVNPETGAPIYQDLNGQATGTFTAANRTANWGTFNPPHLGGIRTNFSYKGFEISALFSYAYGYSRFNNQRFFQENHGFAQFNLYKTMLNIWQRPGDQTNIQSFNFQREFSSKDVEDASFMRLRNVTVSYNLPQSILANTKYIKGVRFYAQGQNLYTWTKFTGFDPEDDNNIAQYEYPTPRTITVGVDINF